MKDTPPPGAPQASLSRVFALLAAGCVLASCGGSSEPDRAAAPVETTVKGTGSIARYDRAGELMVLPQLALGEQLHADVRLRLRHDGTWSLVSAGSARPLEHHDRPRAHLVPAAPHSSLAGALADGTLTIKRIHVDHHVVGRFILRLAGNRWTQVGTHQEHKTLHAEDFKSHHGVHADESHHVVLESHPASGVQDVPLRLADRNYRFCMDPQDDGADGLALLDPAGGVLFDLKAGDACAELTATAGLYTLRHRYGGNGGVRTLFLRNAGNTTSARAEHGTVAPAAMRLLATGRPGTTVPPVVPPPVPGSQQPGVRDFTTALTGPQYWSVYDLSAPNRSVGHLRYGGLKYTYAGGSYCSWAMSFTGDVPWDADHFIEVRQAGGLPYQLGQVMGCTGESGSWRVLNNPGPLNDGGRPIPVIIRDGTPTATTRTYGVHAGPSPLPAPGDGDLVFYPSAFLGGGPADLDPMHNQINGIPVQNIYSRFALSGNGVYIESYAGHTFRPTLGPPAHGPRGPLPPVYVTRAATGELSTGAGGPLNLAIGYRFLPDGIAPNVTLGPGQVALFAGRDCTGKALVSEGLDMPGFNFARLPQAAGVGASFRLGLQTSATAYPGANYAGAPAIHNQLACTNSDSGLGSMRVRTDTVTMTVSTNSCEKCNLTGADLSHVNLVNARLSGADLAGADLTGLDLTGADFRFATLQGATMGRANLEGANLCAALLNGSPAVGVAASLDGAHLKNTNLALAQLDGVSFSGASFYSSDPAPASCQQSSCGSYVAPACASAYAAKMNNTKFDNTYLANVDMGSSTGVAVDFTRARLLGVSFAGATLDFNASTSARTSFRSAYLHGVDFQRTTLAFADFTSAELVLATACAQAMLEPTFGQFPGFRKSVPPSAGCEAGKATAAFCVQATFTAATAYPETSCSNVCADGSVGPVNPQNGSCLSGQSACSPSSWTRGAAAPTGAARQVSSCQEAPLCGTAFQSTRNRCW